MDKETDMAKLAKKLREKLGWEQLDVMYHFRISRRTVSRYENVSDAVPRMYLDALRWRCHQAGIDID